MGLLSRVRSALAFRRAAGPIGLPHFIGPTIPNVWVTETTALRLATAWRCVDILTSTMARLPWQVYERQKDGSREDAPGDPADYLLHISPNVEMTPADWMTAMVSARGLWGNAYAYIQRDGRFAPAALWPLHPSRVTVMRNDSGMIRYRVRDDFADFVDIPPEDMLHVKGLSLDGIIGLNTIDAGRESIALAIAAEGFGAAFYANALRPSGIVQVPIELKDKAYRRLKAAWRKRGGWRKAGNPLILEGGAEWKSIGIQPDEAQHRETRVDQIREVCRFFGVPPHKVGELEHAHYNNMEADEKAFVEDAIVPMALRFEQEANRKLIAPLNRDRRYTKMNLRGLARGSMLDQAKYFQAMMYGGLATRNQIKDLLDENRNDDGHGDDYWKPTNVDWANAPPKTSARPGKKTDDGTERTPADNQPDDAKRRETVAKLVARQLVVARKREDKARARHEGKDTFPSWSDKFYREHRDHISDSLYGILGPIQGVLVGGDVNLTAVCGEAAGLYVARCAAAGPDWLARTEAAIDEVSAIAAEQLVGGVPC